MSICATPNREEVQKFEDYEWDGFDVYYFHSLLSVGEMLEWYRVNGDGEILDSDVSSIQFETKDGKIEFQVCDATDAEQLDDLAAYMASQSIMRDLSPTTKSIVVIFREKRTWPWLRLPESPMGT
jgi:hypothetical protein